MFQIIVNQSKDYKKKYLNLTHRRKDDKRRVKIEV